MVKKIEYLVNINDLANGELVLVNNGSVDLLKTILRDAFPKDESVVNGKFTYYYASQKRENEWNAITGYFISQMDLDISCKPVKPATDFFGNNVSFDGNHFIAGNTVSNDDLKKFLKTYKDTCKTLDKNVDIDTFVELYKF